MNSSERNHLLVEVTRRFLQHLPLSLAETVRAVAVPHWFDAGVLARLLNLSEEEAAERYIRLQEMPFILPLGRGASTYLPQGHALHELIRQSLLDDLWQERREDFCTWSHRAAEYFQEQTGTDVLIEAIYHWLVADPERGADLVQQWGTEWDNTFQYSLLHALVQIGLEHEGAGRLDGRPRGWVRFWKGRLHLLYSDNKEAMASLAQALEAGQGDLQLEAKCLWRLGDAYLRVSEYEAARRRYEEALAIYQEIGDRLGEANCIQGLGGVYLRLSEYKAALERYEEALTIYREIGNHLGEASCIKELGGVYRRLSEYREARARYEEALAIYLKIGNRLEETSCIRGLGDVHLEMSEYGEARARYEEALAICREIGDRLGEAISIKGLGDVHLGMSEYREARARYEEALAIYREIGNQLGEASCIRGLGDVHLGLSEYRETRERYEEALSIYRQIGARLGEAHCTKGLGDMHWMLGEYEVARARYEEALAIYQKIGIRQGEANVQKALEDLALRENPAFRGAPTLRRRP